MDTVTKYDVPLVSVLEDLNVQMYRYIFVKRNELRIKFRIKSPWYPSLERDDTHAYIHIYAVISPPDETLPRKSSRYISLGSKIAPK